MRLKRLRDLSDELGIPVSTIQKWVERDPELSVYKAGGPGGGSHWIKLDRLASRHGMSLVEAYMLGSSRWIKAVLLAEQAKIPRKTMANWCRNRPGFAKRLGRIYYIDLEAFGADPEAVKAFLQRMRLGGRGQVTSEEG
jgi:hypothetical protein